MRQLFFLTCFLQIGSLLTQAQINQLASQHLMNHNAIQKGHIGISMWDMDSQQFLYQYQADQYFTPASTTKLFSMYAGLKCLPSRLPGLRYIETADTLYLFPTGDPTFLRTDFTEQPVLRFLTQHANKKLHFSGMDLRSAPYGKGWSWDDQYETYMPELSAFPIRSNIASVQITRNNGKVQFTTDPVLPDARFIEEEESGREYVHRMMFQNHFSYCLKRSSTSLTVETPFHPGNQHYTARLLNAQLPACNNQFSAGQPIAYKQKGSAVKTIESHPTDSMLKIMMHESDNFLAEQTLLMAGATLMDDTLHTNRAIALFQKKWLPDLSGTVQWIDGSGLSRHNLFTPNDFVYLLKTIYRDVSWERIQAILPTGGEGTLKNLYQSHSGFIYAKTGSMSNVVSLCGYLITKKNKRIAFSIIANQFPGTAQPVRKAIEGFLIAVRNAY